MKRFFQIILILIVVIFIGSILAGIGGMMTLFNPTEPQVSKESILALDLDGVIMDNRDFLDLLRKHRKDKRIKGVLVRINSPGGAVGPSQELYDELRRTREEYKKPVVAFCGAVAASGAYYAAVGADKIVTTPGCMVGSIGALISFVNLEKLYGWAKIHRYSVTTGKFKDAGADYKALTSEERSVFQELLNDVLAQFKEAILAGRKMKPELLDRYADGRVFTGAQAVKLGFADATGSWDDARKLVGELAGLGKDPEVFKAVKKRGFFEYLEEATSNTSWSRSAEKFLKTELQGQPLFILPGAIPL